ncbi:MAG: pyridoxamine 5'-phosphate oxidase family protein [Planctomycetota bacterium]|jgi:nitroimidazol reductase NimA-like FMN-containing flavoprotein (pyridoxamine 5'-phosphate oxidase superfamily)
MRRKEREIKDTAEIEEILNRAFVCRLGLCDNGRPYVVPLCFGYEDNALYFHCAKGGKKLDIIRENNNVCFEVDTDCQAIKAEQACRFEVRYKSVIGFGKALLIEDAELKRRGLDVIMQRFSKEPFEYPQENLKKTMVVKVEIESMTGKKSV